MNSKSSGCCGNTGPATVREVHEAVCKTKPSTGYTTVLKLMQIMADKELVTRDEKNRAHVYRARIPQEQTQRQIVGDLLDRVFGGSSCAARHAGAIEQEGQPDEIAEIRRMLDDYAKTGCVERSAVVNHPLMEVLGWSIIHSLWECCIVALFFAVFNLLFRGADARYVAGCVALVLMLGAPAVTFVPWWTSART